MPLQEEKRHTDTQAEDSYLMTKAEAGVMCLQSKDRWQYQKLEEGRKYSSLEFSGPCQNFGY